VTTQRGVLVLAGPRSRDVLAKVVDVDVFNKAFPWLTARRLSIKAAGVIAMRVNFVGELGYELHHPIEMQNAIFDALMAAGGPFGIKPFGIRAMDSLRLEKSYKLIGRELVRLRRCRLRSVSDGSSISTRVRFLAATRSSPEGQGFRRSW
jgi:dimethylglycine dehydrogenase